MTQRDRFSYACLALLAAACLIVPAATALAGQSSGFEYFVPNGEYVIEVDGQLSPDGEVWVSPKPVALLIRDPQLRQAAILRPGKPEVESMALEYLSGQGARLQVLPDQQTAVVGKYAIQGDGVAFRFDDHDVLLKKRPPLLGYHSSADINDYDSKWGRRAQEYIPDSALIRQARSFPKQAKVTVYFGSWCPHCQAHVPAIMRVENALQGSNVEFVYYGLPRGFGEEPQAKKEGIELIPTAIVAVEGHEVGRIGDGDWSKPEAKLAQLLSQ